MCVSPITDYMNHLQRAQLYVMSSQRHPPLQPVSTLMRSMVYNSLSHELIQQLHTGVHIAHKTCNSRLKTQSQQLSNRMADCWKRLLSCSERQMISWPCLLGNLQVSWGRPGASREYSSCKHERNLFSFILSFQGNYFSLVQSMTDARIFLQSDDALTSSSDCRMVSAKWPVKRNHRVKLKCAWKWVVVM